MSQPDDLRGPSAKRRHQDADEDDYPTIKRHSLAADSDNDSDSDDSGSDDENSELAGQHGIAGDCEYDEDTEELPKYPAFDKDFAQIGTDLISLPKRVVEMIDASDCESHRVRACRENAADLARIPKHKLDKACLLGNTGAGKSSLLNSLLGLPNLAKAMDGGQSCTYVGTEYEAPFKGQTKKLAAKVEYFDIIKIEELLKRLLGNYNKWSFDRDEDMDEDEAQELKRLSTTAFTTFRLLFNDQEQFESPLSGQEFLKASYTSDTSAVEIMVQWCKDLLQEKEADEDDHIEYLDGDTQEEILEQLDPLVSSNSRFEMPSLWPLVKKVRIGIEGPRILDYIILVDLPGIDDTNKVRVDASYEMMRDCDWIWVVTKIGRAITDTTVDALLSRYAKDYKMLVICTGIDDNIDAALATHLHNEGQSVGEHDELYARERTLRNTTKSLLKKIETRRAKLEGRNVNRKGKNPKALSDKARVKLISEVEEHEKSLRLAEDELPTVAQERFQLLVDARNSNTVRRLQEEKSEHMPQGTKLLVSACPIYTTSRSKDYIDHEFKVFIEGLAMWARSYSVERTDELLAIVKASQTKPHSVISRYLTKLLSVNDEYNVQPILEAQSHLIESAQEVLKKKRRWNWATSRAFIRRDGTHKTPFAPQQSWNEQFLTSSTEIVNGQWNGFKDKHQNMTSELVKELAEVVSEVQKGIKAHPAHMVLPMDRVNEMFDAQRRGIEQACHDHQEDLKKELRNMKLDMTQDRGSGYFTQAMAEVYEKCKADSGKGVKERTMSIFDSHLSLGGKRSPFAMMTKKLNAALAKEAKAKNKILIKRLELIFTVMYRNFDNIFDQKIDDKPERALREQFRQYLPQAEEGFADVKSELKRITRKYRGL